MFYKKGLHISDEDQCATCQHMLNGIVCPLLNALSFGDALLSESLLMTDCELYMPFVRHLRVLPDAKP